MSRVLHDQIDFGEAQCPQGVLIGPSGKDGVVGQSSEQLGLDRLVFRDEQERLHAGTPAGLVDGTGNSMVTNGLKICSIMSCGIPQPVSETEPPPWTDQGPEPRVPRQHPWSERVLAQVWVPPQAGL